MKKVYIIGGTMGAGKTTTCQILKQKLDKCVFLDGDWCWDMNPFVVNDETKQMVISNICYMLNNFIRCTEYNNIIFCWVLHEQSIIDSIITNLDTENCEVVSISLIVNVDALTSRLQKDVDDKKRMPDIIDRSIDRIHLYDKLQTTKIDVSNITPEEAASLIVKI